MFLSFRCVRLFKSRIQDKYKLITSEKIDDLSAKLETLG